MTSLLDNYRPSIASKVTSLIPRYGEPRSPIAGSQYVRWYCVFCGEPVRVSATPWPPPIRDCERCAGRHGQIAVPASGPRDGCIGYEDDAVRAMEGD